MDEWLRKSVRMYNTPGHAHFLTYSCFKQRPFLKSATAKGWFIDALANGCRRHDIALWAYVIMPEHVHVLVKPRLVQYSISKFQASVKGSVGMRALSYSKASPKPEEYWEPYYDFQPNGTRHFRFWQRGGAYDRNISDMSDIPQVLTYIHTNPVRRGLSSCPEDWKWSSASFYAGGNPGPLPLEFPGF